MMRYIGKTWLLLFSCFLIVFVGRDGIALSKGETSDKWQENIPKSAEILKAEGKALLDQRNYEEAMIKFKESLKIKPNYYLAIYNLALTHALRGSNLEEPSENDRWHAWKEFEKAENLAAKDGISDPNLYYAMGWLSLMESMLTPLQATLKRSEAYEHFEKSLKIKSDSKATLNALGALYELQGDYERSMDHYERALIVQQQALEQQALEIQAPEIDVEQQPFQVPKIEIDIDRVPPQAPTGLFAY